MSHTHAPHPPRVISGLRAPVTPDAGDSRTSGRSLPQLELDPRTYARAQDCVHCGLCLPACPTYTQNGLEADSPRGRIQIMKDLADGRISATSGVLEHLDLCLDCRACETACPSGVVYHELIEEARAHLGPQRASSLTDRIARAVFLHLFTRPTRLKLAMLPVRLIQRTGLWKPLTAPIARRLPDTFAKMYDMLPDDGPLWETGLARRYPPTANTGANGKPKLRVGFFAGCVGAVLFQDVNRQAIDLLRLAGCEVLVPPSQGCCGAIHHHAGAVKPSEAIARRNIDAFFPSAGEARVDVLVNTIAGCGAMLKDYHHLLRDDPAYAERASRFVGKVRDISELLWQVGLPEPEHEVDRTVVYHHACHLAHAQRVTDPPIQLLARVKGLKVAPLAEADMCCGAAGTYNLQQPEMARALAQRKLDHIRHAASRVCVTGNVGCAMQIQSEADRIDMPLTVTHPVSVLHEAYFGPTT